MPTVLFVCAGNVFRSLSAERALKSVLPPGSNIRVESAGTYANQGKALRDDVRERLQYWGVDPSDHEVRRLTQEILDGADLVVAMSEDHQAFIEQAFGRRSVLYSELAYGDRRYFPDLWEAVPDYKTNKEAARAYVNESIDTIFQNRAAFLQNLMRLIPFADPRGPSGPAPGF